MGEDYVPKILEVLLQALSTLQGLHVKKVRDTPVSDLDTLHCIHIIITSQYNKYS